MPTLSVHTVTTTRTPPAAESHSRPRPLPLLCSLVSLGISNSFPDCVLLVRPRALHRWPTSSRRPLGCHQASLSFFLEQPPLHPPEFLRSRLLVLLAWDPAIILGSLLTISVPLPVLNSYLLYFLSFPFIGETHLHVAFCEKKLTKAYSFF